MWGLSAAVVSDDGWGADAARRWRSRAVPGPRRCAGPGTTGEEPWAGVGVGVSSARWWGAVGFRVPEARTGDGPAWGAGVPAGRDGERRAGGRGPSAAAAAAPHRSGRAPLGVFGLPVPRRAALRTAGAAARRERTGCRARAVSPAAAMGPGAPVAGRTVFRRSRPPLRPPTRIRRTARGCGARTTTRHLPDATSGHGVPAGVDATAIIHADNARRAIAREIARKSAGNNRWRTDAWSTPDNTRRLRCRQCATECRPVHWTPAG